jgi:hypothetical protein
MQPNFDVIIPLAVFAVVILVVLFIYHQKTVKPIAAATQTALDRSSTAFRLVANLSPAQATPGLQEALAATNAAIPEKKAVPAPAAVPPMHDPAAADHITSAVNAAVYAAANAKAIATGSSDPDTLNAAKSLNIASQAASTAAVRAASRVHPSDGVSVPPNK